MPHLMILFLLLSQYQPSSSLSCRPCDHSRCKNEPKAVDCKSGQLSSDVCGCCDRCANAEGETCGGLWNRGGHCADHLYCKHDLILGMTRRGVCKPNTCSTREDCYKEGMMCGSKDADLVNECLCKNGKCKRSSGCGTDLYGRFIKCSQCRNYDCEDEGRCLLKKGKCFAKEKPTSPTKRPPLPTVPFGASLTRPYKEVEKGCNHKGHNCSCKAPLYCDPKDCTCRQLTLEICPPRDNGDPCEKRGTCTRTRFINGTVTEVGRCGCRCGLCKEVTEGEEHVWQMCQATGGYKIPSARKYLLIKVD